MKQIHQGSYHCGQVRFKINADLGHVNLRVNSSDFHLRTPLENPTLTTFNTHTAKD